MLEREKGLFQKITETSESLKMCNLFDTNHIYVKTVRRRSKITRQQGSVATLLRRGGQNYSHLRQVIS